MSGEPVRSVRRIRPAETERRDAVYRAAMTLIAERGIEATRITDIGRRVGMSAGHVMYYFGTKERLLLETLRWSEDQLRSMREAALRHGRAGWPKLRRFSDVYMPDDAADPRWRLWIETWRGRAGDVTGSLAEFERRWQDDCERILAEGIDRGVFRPVDVVDVAVRYIALLDGLSIEIIEGTRPRDQAMALAERGARVELEPAGAGGARPAG